MSEARLPVASAVICSVALVAALAGQAALLGMLAAALTATLGALGLRSPGRTSRLTYAVVGIWAATFCGLLGLAYATHDPAGELFLVGGFPAGTAMLVYGTTPLGAVLGVLYGLSFDREVLPRDRQDAFLGRFGGE